MYTDLSLSTVVHRGIIVVCYNMFLFLNKHTIPHIYSVTTWCSSKQFNFHIPRTCLTAPPSIYCRLKNNVSSVLTHISVYPIFIQNNVWSQPYKNPYCTFSSGPQEVLNRTTRFSAACTDINRSNVVIYVI